MLLIHIFRIKYNIIECYLYLLKGTNKSFFGWGGGAKRIILISIHFNEERWFEIRVFWVTSVVLEQNKYHISRDHCTTQKTFAWHLPTVLMIANNLSSRKEMLNMFNNFFCAKTAIWLALMHVKTSLLGHSSLTVWSCLGCRPSTSQTSSTCVTCPWGRFTCLRSHSWPVSCFSGSSRPHPLLSSSPWWWAEYSRWTE